MSAVLQIQDLNVAFSQDGRQVDAVRGVSFEVARGEVVALVGESGSGKSVTAMSSVALLGANAKVTGSIRYNGQQMVGATADLLQQVRGNEISFIFQEPMTSLNPLHTIEKQLRESIELHQDPLHSLTGAEIEARIIALLERVGLPSSSPSLGELTLQAKQNLQAPWLGFTAFFTFAIMLALLVFIFEGVRDAFDPRKTFQ